MKIYFIDGAWSVLGRFHQNRGAETGWGHEGWRELGQPLLFEPLQRCIQTSSYWYTNPACLHSTIHLHPYCLSLRIPSLLLLPPADLMMGLPVTEDLYSIFSKEKEHEEKEKESQRGAQEQVSLLLQTYMQLLLPDDEKFHGGWALINCDMRFVNRCPVWFCHQLLMWSENKMKGVLKHLVYILRIPFKCLS